MVRAIQAEAAVFVVAVVVAVECLLWVDCMWCAVLDGCWCAEVEAGWPAVLLLAWLMRGPNADAMARCRGSAVVNAACWSVSGDETPPCISECTAVLGRGALSLRGLLCVCWLCASEPEMSLNFAPEEKEGCFA